MKRRGIRVEEGRGWTEKGSEEEEERNDDDKEEEEEEYCTS